MAHPPGHPHRRSGGHAGQGRGAGGSVVYSGSGLKGYGNLIIVKHNSRYLSAYAFNRRLLVREGDRVKRGQALAEVGQAPNGQQLLHFEIRRDGSAVDPLQYLPRSL
jgi:lipoprotein NlpD